MALVAFGAWSCAGPAKDPVERSRPSVVASIFPLGDLTTLVAGTDLTVDVLVPPRADPSTFEPSPRRLHELAGARAFILVGGGVDDWARSVLEDIPRVVLNDGLALLEGSEDPADPHIWLDPILVRDSWLPRIVAALVAALPDAREDIEGRGRVLADSLTSLDVWMSSRLAPLRGRAFVATHPGLELPGCAPRHTRSGRRLHQSWAGAFPACDRRPGRAGTRRWCPRCIH